MLRSLRSLKELQPWNAPLLLAHLHRLVCGCTNLLQIIYSVSFNGPCEVSKSLLLLSRLYEKHGEAAVRSFSQFYPTITPADVMIMAQQSHFLAYLDNLVQSQTEEHRYILSTILFLLFVK